MMNVTFDGLVLLQKTECLTYFFIFLLNVTPGLVVLLLLIGPLKLQLKCSLNDAFLTIPKKNGDSLMT